MNTVLILVVLTFGADDVPEVDCREDFPARCTSGLEAGQKAPFAGVLLTGDLGAHLFLVEKNQKKRIDAVVKKERDTAKTKLDYEKDLRHIDQNAFEEKLDIIKEAHARDLENIRPAWYEHPAFVIPVAVVATVGIIAISVKVMEARR